VDPLRWFVKRCQNTLSISIKGVSETVGQSESSTVKGEQLRLFEIPP